MLLRDNKYEDNVVLQKDALQELLTNIKNYPIVDIDYVDENEVDQLHDNYENGNDPDDWKIWENYTDGTPCIKITYGDTETTKGNIIFAETLNKLIRDAKKDRENKGKQRDELDKLLKFWEDVQLVNEQIFNNRTTTLNNWLTSQGQTAISDWDNISDLEHSTLLNGLTDSQSQQSLSTIFSHIYDLFDATINSQANKEEYIKIKELKVRNTDYKIRVPVIIDRDKLSTDVLTYLSSIQTESQYTPIERQAAQILYNALNNYPHYEQMNTLNASDQEVLSIQQYVLKYLQEVINTAKTKYDAATNALNSISVQKNDLEVQINNLNDQIYTWKEIWIPQIANGSKILVENNGEYSLANPSGNNNVKDRTMHGYKYVKVGSNILWDKNINFEEIADPDNIIQRNGHFRVTINGHTYEIPIKGFEQSGPIVADTSNGFLENVQYYKEFFDNSEPPISLGIHELGWDNNEIEQSPIEGVIYYLSKDNEILPTGNGITNLGSPNNKWGTIYGIDLGSEDDPFEHGYFEHGYFDEIKIGDVVIGGEGGSGDSSKFLRGDGAWSNELTGSILISDDTEAIRRSHRYIEADIDTMISNNILILDEDPEFISQVKYKELRNGNPNVKLYVVGDGGTVTIKNESPDTTITTNAREIIEDEIINDSFSYYLGQSQTGVNYVLAVGGPYHSNDLPGSVITLTTHQYIFAENQAKNYYLLLNEIYTPCEQNIRYTNETVFYILNNYTWYDDPATGQGQYNAEVIGSIATYGGISARKSIKGYKVYGAVFNDYAEYRTTLNTAEPGRCVIDLDDGSLQLSIKRLMPGAQIISDTFGTCMGETEQHQTPLAVAGRVLAYPYRTREEYHAGMAVCSAPNGTVDIMTREEIRDYPDAIIGIVSEIPQYDVWGSDNVQVNGRIWIKVK